MAGKRANFLKADLSRAIKAAAAAKLNIGRVEITPNGSIVLHTDNSTTYQAPVDELEAWRARRHARTA